MFGKTKRKNSCALHRNMPILLPQGLELYLFVLPLKYEKKGGETWSATTYTFFFGAFKTSFDFMICFGSLDLNFPWKVPKYEELGEVLRKLKVVLDFSDMSFSIPQFSQYIILWPNFCAIDYISNETGLVNLPYLIFINWVVRTMIPCTTIHIPE